MNRRHKDRSKQYTGKGELMGRRGMREGMGRVEGEEGGGGAGGGCWQGKGRDERACQGTGGIVQGTFHTCMKTTLYSQT